MKTKEEIEQLAKQLCNISIDLVIDEEERYYKNFQKFDGVVLGYTQCQEDNKDKKYTEEDMYNCWQTAFTDAMNCSNKDYTPFWFKDYINSINKQD